MKSAITYAILTLSTILSLHAQSPADKEAAALIARVTPDHAQFFKVDTSLPQQEGKDLFKVSDTKDGKILIRGNNGVSVASGYHWYLKNRTHCHLSWCGDQLKLPKTLPKVGESVTIVTPLKYRTYFNYCTLSYTGAWWDWERWQREIDFMAMNGINMPLSPIGLEAVWYNTLLKHRFTDAEAREFLVGPAFFAWQWMSNIENHCGPLPKSWIDQSIIRGKKILDRQRALGMTPIQQGFTGHVPRLLKQKYPNAKVLIKKDWIHFKGAAQLDPLDPLFSKMGKTFLEEQQKLFGTSHLYGCDPFHEGEPPVETEDYLNKVGKNIHKLITTHDPEGMIIMQSWSIREHIATAIPKKDLLILDLSGRRMKQYNGLWGYNFVYGPLHNFGGRIKLHGDLAKLSSNDHISTMKKYPNCIGMGLFMEGIIHNPVYYDYVFDNIWRDQPTQVNQWLYAYAHRRYGAKSANANKAWDVLLKSAYKTGTDGVEASSMVCARPAISPKKSGPNKGFAFPYKKPKLLEAWTHLLADADKLKSSDAYRYDIVDVGRQVLSDHAHTVYTQKVTKAWNDRDLKAFDSACAEFDQLLLDIDSLLATRSEFLLGKWIDDARAHGTTKQEKDLYEKNARTLITAWGPLEESLGDMKIYDYSWREWSGLIKDFYLPRWQKHHAMLRKHLVDGTPYSEDKLPKDFGRLAYRANDFYKELAKWEINWATQPSAYPSAKPQGDSIELARQFHSKYHASIQSMNQNKQTPEKPNSKGNNNENLGEPE